MDETSHRTVVLTAAIVAIALVSVGSPVSATASGPDHLTASVDDGVSIASTQPIETASLSDDPSQIEIQTQTNNPAQPLQGDQGAHLAALLGIVALALLGSSLVVRNRLEGRSRAERGSRETGNEEFMTDRERVRQLVTKNGGRMKQADIVDSVEWSKAKVSRLLADLESEDEITKLRLGRENLICLRGQEPAASQSPEGAGDD